MFSPQINGLILKKLKKKKTENPFNLLGCVINDIFYNPRLPPDGPRWNLTDP